MITRRVLVNITGAQGTAHLRIKSSQHVNSIYTFYKNTLCNEQCLINCLEGQSAYTIKIKTWLLDSKPQM